MSDGLQQDAMIQRGIDEALACQGMLDRAPLKPSLLAQATEWMKAAVHWLAPRPLVFRQRMTSSCSNGQLTE